MREADSLRIMHVLNSNLWHGGGVVNSVVAQTEGLASQGHAVAIVSLDCTQPWISEKYTVFSLSTPLHIRYHNKILPIPWRVTKQLTPLINQFKPDIIHLHHPFLIGPAAATIATSYSIPLLFTYHTRYEDYLHYLPISSFITKPLCQQTVKNFCQRMQSIIAPSLDIYHELQQKLPAVKSHHLPSPLLSLFFRPFTFQPPSNPFRLLTVSRFVVEKNIPFLLNAFSLLPRNKYIFTLVGYGPYESYLQYYAYEVLHLPPKEVIFKQASTKEELVDCYAHADLFLFASTTETQGLVLAEAMATGTPVVALNGPGQREIIKEKYNGFLVEAPLKMAHRIQEIRDFSSERYQHLQYNAWQTGQEYSVDTFIPKLIAVYQEAIEKKSCQLWTQL